VISPLSGGARRRPKQRRGSLPLGLVAGIVVGALALWVGLFDLRDPRHLLVRSAAAVPHVLGGTAIQEALGPLPSRGPGAVALEGRDALHLEFKKPPRAGLLFDVDSGQVLWRRHPLARMPIASLTKIMTALIVVDRTSSRERAKITRAALDYAGRGVGLPKGKRVPVEGLLHGMLLVSGNDAAKALAIHVGHDEHRFVGLMNGEAERLGLRCSHFVSPHGLERGNASCAADLAAMARLAMREERIRRVVRKSSAAVRFPVAGGRLFVNSTNPLYHPRYRGTIGLKTGFTDPAGMCYVGVVHRGRRRLGVVLLHSPNPSEQARKLFDAAFRHSR
jgi:D-alanyl-D-alanine carboxypeptidase